MFFCKRVMLNILTIFLVNLYKNKLFRDLKYLAESWNLYLYSNGRHRFSESVVFKISPWNSKKRLMNNFLYKETEKSNFFFWNLLFMPLLSMICRISILSWSQSLTNLLISSLTADIFKSM